MKIKIGGNGQKSQRYINFATMTYPKNFEQKIGFDEVRAMLKRKCLSRLGEDMVDNLAFSSQYAVISLWLRQVGEFRKIEEGDGKFPIEYFFDMRQSLKRAKLENTHLDEKELFDLRRSLETIIHIVVFLNKNDGNADAGNTEENATPANYFYPALHHLCASVKTFPHINDRIDGIMDNNGNIRDDASPALSAIRTELSAVENSVSRILNRILRSAQNAGVVEKDVTPAMRDGRLVIPIAPDLKRKIKGIVHDESASGRTIFIEPEAVVEANNRIRELENAERQEIIRILTELTDYLRPYIGDVLESYKFLGVIDFIRAKALLAIQMKAIEPVVVDRSHIDWIQAAHPLLRLSLEKQGRKVVPLDIMLTGEKRILIISGPNAGGKSVCLKTVGLLQYMLQCGLAIPVGERSTAGVFRHLMMDMGDEQSLENDLSTYSSHLLNMKMMIKTGNDRTLLMIDEFGSGTEPGIGGAIAQAVLEQFCKNNSWAVITTHYQNLKHFADNHPNVVNGAMLYDRHEMKPLFQLAIGQPGSSFAIEIARNIGLPEEVIKEAGEIVGTEYIQSDKYLQDIVRDKRYWSNKRETIHRQEKMLNERIEKYESTVREIEASRKEILNRAKEQAGQLLQESNKQIENTIREIKEKQAEKEETRRIREELKNFGETVLEQPYKLNPGNMSDEEFQKKVEQLKRRKERRVKRKADKQKSGAQNLQSGQAVFSEEKSNDRVMVGNQVRMKGLTTVGTIEEIDGKEATVIFGTVRTHVKLDQLERTNKTTSQDEKSRERDLGAIPVSMGTRSTIDEHRSNFHEELDVRGMRGDEALSAVQYFIDDAILVGVSRVRILHGKGNGILRQLIRQYLSTVPNVSKISDEHVRFGGAGITVVEL